MSRDVFDELNLYCNLVTSTPCAHAHAHSKDDAAEDVKEFAMRLDKIVALLDSHFGEINHEEVENQHKLIINVDSNEVKINVETMVSMSKCSSFVPTNLRSACGVSRRKP